MTTNTEGGTQVLINSFSFYITVTVSRH